MKSKFRICWTLSVLTLNWIYDLDLKHKCIGFENAIFNLRRILISKNKWMSWDDVE